MNSQPLDADLTAALARIIAAESVAACAKALAGVVANTADNDGIAILLFRRDAQPEVLHHTLDARRARHYLDRYLAGPYLLDPLYQLALQRSFPGICRYRDAAPDRFRSSEYYHQYVERTHLADEVDFLARADAQTTVVMVVGRFTQRFSKAEVRRLESIEVLVHAAMLKAWKLGTSTSDPVLQRQSVHQRLTECFENFGAPLLTRRERETTQLLLRGFSTKAIARRLRIAPGTVMVHKRNLFSKLGISSQYELFSRFVQSLSEDP